MRFSFVVVFVATIAFAAFISRDHRVPAAWRGAALPVDEDCHKTHVDYGGIVYYPKQFKFDAPEHIGVLPPWPAEPLSPNVVARAVSKDGTDADLYAAVRPGFMPAILSPALLGKDLRGKSIVHPRAALMLVRVPADATLHVHTPKAGWFPCHVEHRGEYRSMLYEADAHSPLDISKLHYYNLSATYADGRWRMERVNFRFGTVVNVDLRRN